MRDGICCGEEGAIEPSSALAYELGQCIRHIRFADSALHVAEDPGKGLACSA